MQGIEARQGTGLLLPTELAYASLTACCAGALSAG